MKEPFKYHWWKCSKCNRVHTTVNLKPPLECKGCKTKGPFEWLEYREIGR